MRLRIRTKLIAYFLVIAMLVPVLGGAALGSLRSVSNDVDQLSEQAIPRSRSAERLAQLQRDQEVAALSYLAAGKAEDRQKYLDIAQQFEGELEALAKSDTSDAGKKLVKDIQDQRSKFAAAGGQLLIARDTLDQQYLSLRTKHDEMVSELTKIRARYVGTPATRQDPSTIAVSLRTQINDLLLGGEGMLRAVAQEFALAAGYSYAPDEAQREQFKAAGTNFANWLAIANAAGGPDDRAVLSGVQSKFTGEFEPSARQMMAAVDTAGRARASFSQSSSSVGGLLGQYTGIQQQAVAAARDSAAGAVGSTQTQVMIVTLAALVIALGLGFFLANTFTRPIVHLRDAANDVSMGKANNVQIDVTTKDEIEELADAFQRMVASIRFLNMKQDDDDDEDDFDFAARAAS